MVYLKALDTLYNKKTSTAADGTEMPCVIRRASWPDGKILILAKDQPRIAMANLNTSTQKHQSPNLKRELTTIYDLGGKDWDYIDANSYF